MAPFLDWLQMSEDAHLFSRRTGIITSDNQMTISENAADRVIHFGKKKTIGSAYFAFRV